MTTQTATAETAAPVPQAGPARKPRAPRKPRVMPARKFGVEIEGYGVSRTALAAALSAAGVPTRSAGYTHATTSYWKVVSDASLVGGQTFEVVSPILEGEEGLKQIEAVCKVLAEQGARVNRSCGLHVHVDARDLSVDNLKNVVKAFCNDEAVFDTLMPTSRRTNGYCLSVANRIRHGIAVDGAGGDIKAIFKRVDKARTVREVRAVLGHARGRLNLEALERHGTVEFRQHGGTHSAEKITAWARLVVDYVEYLKPFKKIRPYKTDVATLTKRMPKPVQAYFVARIARFARTTTRNMNET